jgi:ubiquinone/menaquinone biosynthesis C-methylase UbiE
MHRTAQLFELASEFLPMPDATKFQFTDASVPKAYDEYLVPRLFEPWAKKLVDEVELKSGEIILDIATGPGTVARQAASKLGSDGHVFAIDLSKPMLDVARAKPAPARAARIEYLQSPAAPLPGSSDIFDAVFCHQGMQFFPDRLAALREMRRVLKPNGRAAVAVWAQLERNQIFAAYHAALRATAPEELASLLAAPFCWPDGTVLQRAAEEAGFRQVRLVTLTLPMMLEGGVEQAVRAFSAMPVSPCVAALPLDVQKAFFARVREEMAALQIDGKIVGETVSNIIVAKR